MFSRAFLNVYKPFVLLNVCMLYLSWTVIFVNGEKYSKDMNEGIGSEQMPDFKTLEKPFRMAKLNLIWTKAIKRVTSDSKLKSLLSDMKLQDKDEILWKKLKAEGKDKEGLKEAELRRKLKAIMVNYDLSQHFDDILEPSEEQTRKLDSHLNKSLFKDKKLNKLWEKAEVIGFSEIELKTLKEEFTHHQEKIDQYYELLQVSNNMQSDEYENHIDRFNAIGELEQPNKDVQDVANMIRKRHGEIKDGFDRLHRLAVGPENKEFMEPKVQGLWKLALEADFTLDELESLKSELKHYEQRLLKLRHLQAEAVLVAEQNDKEWKDSLEESDGPRMNDRIKKHVRKVEKIHEHLETRILQRHIEL